jgi:hypothetical protein
MPEGYQAGFRIRTGSDARPVRVAIPREGMRTNWISHLKKFSVILRRLRRFRWKNGILTEYAIDKYLE